MFILRIYLGSIYKYPVKILDTIKLLLCLNNTMSISALLGGDFSPLKIFNIRLGKNVFQKFSQLMFLKKLKKVCLNTKSDIPSKIHNHGMSLIYKYLNSPKPETSIQKVHGDIVCFFGQLFWCNISYHLIIR